MAGILAVTADAEQPLIVELWGYFYDTYLTPDVYYENLNLTSNELFSIMIFIFGLCVGLSLASFGAVFNKRVLGGVVRRLLEKQALSPESALTLDELGYPNSLLVNFAVKKSTSLRRVVKCREELEFDAEQARKREEHDKKRADDKKLPRFKEAAYKINVYEDKFYIPEDMKYTADVKFEKKGTTWLGAVIFTVIMMVVFVVLVVFLPQILELVNDVAGIFDTSPDNIL